MKIKFTKDVSLEDSLAFEVIYAENLQYDLAGKQELKDDGIEFVYLVDGDTGAVIGESYFIPLASLKDWPPEEDQPDEGLEPYYDKNAMYCYSTTILPEYQGKGYGAILKSYYLGLCAARGFDYSIGHARFNGSIQLNQSFGAKIVGEFSDWYKTGEVYYLYVQELCK
jgi:GNAT superfamily N-acetyltransferase